MPICDQCLTPTLRPLQYPGEWGQLCPSTLAARGPSGACSHTAEHGVDASTPRGSGRSYSENKQFHMDGWRDTHSCLRVGGPTRVRAHGGVWSGLPSVTSATDPALKSPGTMLSHTEPR